MNQWAKRLFSQFYPVNNYLKLILSRKIFKKHQPKGQSENKKGSLTSPLSFFMKMSDYKNRNDFPG